MGASFARTDGRPAITQGRAPVPLRTSAGTRPGRAGARAVRPHRRAPGRGDADAKHAAATLRAVHIHSVGWAARDLRLEIGPTIGGEFVIHTARELRDLTDP